VQRTDPDWFWLMIEIDRALHSVPNVRSHKADWVPSADRPYVIMGTWDDPWVIMVDE